jgi:hypothetical protein
LTCSGFIHDFSEGAGSPGEKLESIIALRRRNARRWRPFTQVECTVHVDRSLSKAARKGADPALERLVDHAGPHGTEGRRRLRSVLSASQARLMPRYFFDTIEQPGAHLVRDEDGLEFPDVSTARREALSYMGGIARDELPDGDYQEFVVSVREEAGAAPLLTITMTVKVERPAGGDSGPGRGPRPRSAA